MSKLPFELLMALRYLRPRRTFVSVITVISILGVMLGVAVLIIVIAVMQGFDEQTKAKIFGFNAHLRVMESGPMKDWRTVADLIRRNPQVRGVAPYVLGQVLIKTQPEEANPQVLAPVVRGLDPALERDVSLLPTSMVDGAFDVRGRSLLVGAAMASKLHLNVGDRVAVYSVRDFEALEKTRKEGTEEAALGADYVINGIFDVGYNEYNELFVITSLGNAQDMYALEDTVHGLIVTLRDPEQANRVRTELYGLIGGSVQISTWMDENRPLLEAILVEKNVMFYLLFFIVLVAAFGITSALITFVIQKTREIGVLKALGATRAQVTWIFLSQSLIVGVFGVIAGYGTGMLALAYRNDFLRLMRRTTGFELFPASIYNFTELPSVIVSSDIAIICGGSLVICLLAGMLPAWSAGRLHPVEALRHE
jgi:lipoprotein-releasing system permease protein